ncbi:MAG: N-acetyltransferase [Acidimicrobiia bacterium]
MAPYTFVPVDFQVPDGLHSELFRLEPLGPQHNERDHEAWMSSIEHIRSTPGFEEGGWPSPMTAERNLEDLERHATDFRQRRGFTYSVIDAESVVGCVYIYPSLVEEHDADVRSWVRASRAELDEPLWLAVSGWMRTTWPFSNPRYTARV